LRNHEKKRFSFLKVYKENKMDNICNFCSKEFSSKTSLINHQRTVKRCLEIQGKEDKETSIECLNCKKILAVRSYKQHKIKCDIIKEESEKTRLYDEIKEKYKLQDKQIKELRTINNKYDEDLKEERMWREETKNKKE
jgi:hypothetical protein